MSKYNFTITLYPYGDKPGAGIVEIDSDSQYGYFEHRDGSEGGGLWFEGDKDTGLELTDYDGVYVLPRPVVAALRAHGVTVPSEF
jgi:hypothetical protein